MTQTIEQLTARVRELEEENARLVKLDAKRKKQLSDFDDVIDDLNVVVSCINPVEDLKRAIAALKEQAAASQAYAEQLREKIEALWDIIDDIDSYGDMAKADDKLFRSLVEKRQKDRWETGITTDGYVLNMPIPHDTSALDAYVADKAQVIIESARELCTDQQKQIAALTRQVTLAVEALEKIAKKCNLDMHGDDGSLGGYAYGIWNTANSTISTIKESENNKAS